MTEQDELFITPEQAISLLPEGEQIHTFRAQGIMIGADWKREDIIQLFNKYPNDIQVGGKQCVSMGHGIVVKDNLSYLFIQNDKQKLIDFENSIINHD